jgi:hypothetical protein
MFMALFKLRGVRMSGNQSNPTRQAEVVARYPALFHHEFNGRVTTPGLPSVGEGRLFKTGGWFMTACNKHAKGKPVRERPGSENLHIAHAFVDGKRIVRARRYIRATDSFEEVDPSTVDRGEE